MSDAPKLELVHGEAPAVSPAARVERALRRAIDFVAPLLAKGGVFVAWWGADGDVRTLESAPGAAARARMHLLRASERRVPSDPVPEPPTARERADALVCSAIVGEMLTRFPHNPARAHAEAQRSIDTYRRTGRRPCD